MGGTLADAYNTVQCVVFGDVRPVNLSCVLVCGSSVSESLATVESTAL